MKQAGGLMPESQGEPGRKDRGVRHGREPQDQPPRRLGPLVKHILISIVFG
jgi:hypothetical protein